MSTTLARPVVTDGILYLDGGPRLLLAGDYPYYRDDPRWWPAKLAAMRAAGIEVVTCYVPWRHHEIDGRYVFTGPGNRDLLGFLAAIRQAGLLVLAKPGPHVHAELPVGGLPDRVSPTVDPRRLAALAADGQPLRSHGAALPSPVDPAYAADVAEWLAAVGAALSGWQYPEGPLVAVQVGNEGSYGETALPVHGYDYAAVDGWAPRRWTSPAALDGLRPYLRWGGEVSRALGDGLRGYAAGLGLDVPAYANLSPPAPAGRAGRHAPARYDAWLVRGRGRGAGVHYGYTSWVGDAATDDEALVNLVLAAARARGPSLEENWSLPWADPAWQSPATPIFNGLLGLACGATGLTVYTACATAGWGAHLEMPDAVRSANPAWTRPPYGGAAPIGVDGTPGASLPALRVLAAFLSAQGADLVRAVPAAPARWYALREPSALAAWQPPPGATVAGHGLPPPLASTLPAALRACLRHGLQLALLEDAEPGSRRGADPDPVPGDGPVVAASGFLMAAADQRRLARFAAGGGALLLLGELPSLDESLRPCTVLADALGRGHVLPPDQRGEQALRRWLAAHATADAVPTDPDLIQLRRRTRDGGVFVFMFRRSARAGRVETGVDGAPLTVDLAGYGVAVIRLIPALGRIAACYVKGIDERAGNHAPVRVGYAADLVTSSEPCDLSLISGGERPIVQHTGTPINEVLHCGLLARGA